MLPIKLLVIIAAVALVLVFAAPVHYLILFDLTLIPYVGHWSLGGVRLDITDVIVASLGVAVLLRQRSALRKRIPYFFPWLILAIFMSLSYLASPESTRSGTDLVRISYQLYRYCWKPLLYYPICIILLRSGRKAHSALIAAVVGADLIGLMAIQQGYNYYNPRGPFATGNELGMALDVPLIIAFSGTLFPVSRAHWIFSGLSFAILARAILFSASRGSMAAFAAASAFLVSLACLLPAGRRRLLRMMPVAFACIALLFVIRPDLLDRSSIRHAMTAVDGTRAGTMQWRIKERWPYFFNKALESPLLGSGTAVEDAFGDAANTPHNGYLTLANRNGFVVPILYLFFFYRLIRDSLKTFRRKSDLTERMIPITLLAATLSFMLHNIVDTGLTASVPLRFFWMLCALGALRAHVSQPLGTEAESEPSNGFIETTARVPMAESCDT